jgi:hypothetical protein
MSSSQAHALRLGMLDGMVRGVTSAISSQKRRVGKLAKPALDNMWQQPKIPSCKFNDDPFSAVSMMVCVQPDAP